jgi:hypothetical protein
VLQKARPQACAGTGLEGVCTDAHDAKPRSRVAAKFAVLHEEIHTAGWPLYLAIARRKSSRAADPPLKPSDQVIESFKEVKPFALHELIMGDALS